MANNTQIGVYKIKFALSPLVYIGSTNSFTRRKKEHLSLLIKNKHSNKTLQSLYNQFEGNGIQFELVETIDNNSDFRDLLAERELHHINLNSNNLINISKNTKTAKKSYTRTALHIERLKELCKKSQKIAASTWKGSKHTLDSKIKMSITKNPNKKIGMYDLENNLLSIFSNTSEICEKLKIKSSNLRNNLYGITNTCRGNIFKYIINE